MTALTVGQLAHEHVGHHLTTAGLSGVLRAVLHGRDGTQVSITGMWRPLDPAQPCIVTEEGR